MSNHPRILEFEFNAYIETSDNKPTNLARPNDVETRAELPNDLSHRKTPEEIINELNNKSDKVAQQIQQELRRTLPVGLRAEVDIQFYEGSIAAIGSVILLFLRPLVEEAGKQALEKSFEAGFSRMIQFAVRRVPSRFVRGIPINGPLEVNVQATAPITDSQTVAQISQTGNLGYLLPLTAANSALLIVLIIVVAGRLFSLLP